MTRKIDTKTKLAGLIGHPVGHSVSPYLQNTLADRYGINMAYLAFDVASDGEIYNVIKGTRAMGAIGFNVTVPYKKSVMPFLAGIDETAKKIGAVNTMKLESDGYHGYNTDMPGFCRALDYAGISVSGKNVVMVGAGGAANAVLCGLLEKKAGNILILNRTVEKAEALADRFRDSYQDTKIFTAKLENAGKNPDNDPEKQSGSIGTADDFITIMDKISSNKWTAIQCTSVGMSPDIDKAPIEENAFYERLDAAFDIIFNPRETLFLRKAREQGAATSNGLGMLLFQGIRSFEIWNDLNVDDGIAAEMLAGMDQAMG